MSALESLGFSHVNKRVALFVISTLSGGTPATNFDLMRAVRSDFRTLLLTSDSKLIRMYDVLDREIIAIEQHELKYEINPVDHASTEYELIVASWISKHRVELIHVRHLAWHSINLPFVARTANIPCILSLHDYYMICPSVKLLDNAGRYCGGRCGPGGECQQELWPASSMPKLKNSFIHSWQYRSAEVLAQCDALVVTSQFALKLYSELFPSTASRMHLIPHGRDFKYFLEPSGISNNNEGPFRILLSNVNSPAKGSVLLDHICRLVPPNVYEFHILGEWNEASAPTNAVIHGVYKRDDFAEVVKNIGPHIGMVAAIWPETYCHVLTELWAAGLPVLAVDTGAVGERIRAQGGGWLLEVADANLVVDVLQYLRANPEEVTRECAAVYRLQRDHLAQLTSREMAGCYLSLYNAVAQHSQKI